MDSNISGNDDGLAIDDFSLSATLAQPPVNTVPGAQNGLEDVNLVFSTANGNAISVADADSTTLTVTLSVAHGALTLSGITGLSFTTGDGTDDATMTFSGTAAAINTALNGLIYRGALNYNGGDSLSITTSDGALSDNDSVALTLAAVNDPAAVTNLAGDIATFTPGVSNLVHLDSGTAATLTNVDTALHNFLTVTIADPVGMDALFIDTSGTVAVDFGSGVVSVGGVSIGSLSSSPTSLTITFDFAQSTATIQTLMQAISYTSLAATTATAGTRTINWVLQDRGGTANGGNPDLTFNTFVNVVAVNTAGSLSIGDASPGLALEGDQGNTTPVTFTVTRGGGSTGAVSATWSINLIGGPPDYASADDFVATTGTVSFADGQTTATITVLVHGDFDYEDYEDFFVVLSAPTGGVGIDDASGMGTIFSEDPIITGTAGNDNDVDAPALLGTSDDDYIQALGGDDEVFAFAGNDRVDAGEGDDYVSGGAGSDTLFGEAGIDVLDGGQDNDSLYGGDDHDRLIGGLGIDYLDGGAGDDYINGGTSSTGGPDNDFIHGGDGIDRVGYFTYVGGAGVNVSLFLQGFSQDTGSAGSDTLTGIENVSGTAFADVILGDNGNNWLWGAQSNFRVNPSTLVTSTTNNDQISGYGGDDLITVGIGDHVVDGGNDNDTFRFTENFTITEAGITVSLLLQGSAQASGYGSWTLTNFENLSGGQGGDTLTGDGNANRITGERGDDHIAGGGGDDTLSGDLVYDADTHGTGFSGVATLMLATDQFGDVEFSGNDTIDGGLGEDTVVYYFTAGPGVLQLVADGADTLLKRDGETIARIGYVSGVLTVTGLNSGGHIGTDSLTGVEHISFAIEGGAPLVYDVSPPADTPPAGQDSIITGTEDTPYVFTLADFPFTDADGDTLTHVRITTLPIAGTLYVNGVAVTAGENVAREDIVDAAFVYVPLANASGAASDGLEFQVVVTGNVLDPTPNVLIIDIQGTPDFATGTDHEVVAAQAQAYVFTYADFGYYDADGDAMAGVYIHTNASSAGQIYHNGTPLTGTSNYVSIEDINAGLLTFLATGTGDDYATFGFQVVDTTGNVTGLDQITRTMTIDVPPPPIALDLDTGQAGIDYAGAFTEQGAAAAISNAAHIVTQSGTVSSLIIQLTDGTAGDQLTFNSGLVPGGFIVNASATQIAIFGIGSAATYEAILASVRYNNGTDNPTLNGNVDRVISVVASDHVSGQSSPTAYAVIQVTPVNDLPTLGGQATGDIFEDATFSTSGQLTISDPDQNEARFQSQNVSGNYGSFQISESGAWQYSANYNQFMRGGHDYVDTFRVWSWDNSSYVDVVVTSHGNDDAPNIFISGGNTVGYVFEDGSLEDGHVVPINDVDEGENGWVAGDFTTAYGTFHIEQNGTWLYTLNNNAPALLTLNSGQTVTDTHQLTSLGGNVITLQVQVNGANEPPGPPILVNPIADTHVLEDNAVNYQLPANTFFDPDSTITYSATLVGGGALPGWLNFDANTRTFSGTPPLNYEGTLSIRVTASDGSGSAFDDFDLVIDPVNDAPTITGIQGDAITYIENSGLVLLDLGANAVLTDPDSGNFAGGSLTVGIYENYTGSESITPFSGGAVTPSSGNVLVNGINIGTGGSAGMYYVVNFNANATAALVQILLRSFAYRNNSENPPTATKSFAWTLVDGDGTANGGTDTVVVTSTLTIVSVNDAPTGTDKAVTLLEDGSYTIATADFGYADLENNVFAGVVITTLPGAGTLTLNGNSLAAGSFVTAAQIAGGQLVFTPAANGNGNGYASFTFQVRDTGGTASGGVDTDQSPNTLTFNVTSVNDAPVVDNLPGDAVIYYEGGAPVPLDLGANALILDDNANFNGGSLTVGISDATYFPPQDRLTPFSGAVTSNGSGVMVNGVTIGSFVSGGRFFVINFNANATAERVQILLNSVAYFNGEPDNPIPGRRDFVWTLVDGGGTANGGQDSTTFTTHVTVGAINDAPSGIDAAVTLNEDGSHIFTAADFAYTDPENNGLGGVVITTLPGAGTLTLDGNTLAAGTFVTAAQLAAGALRFVPAPETSGDAYASFTFQVRDNAGTDNSGQDTDQSPNTLTLNVTPLNDAPTSTGLDGDAVTFVEGGDYTYMDVGQDTIIADIDSVDFNGGTLTVQITGGYVAGQDELPIIGTFRVVAFGSEIIVDGFTIGSLSRTDGTLTFVFNEFASADRVGEVIRAIQYWNSNTDDPSPGTRTISWTLTDGDGTANGGADTLLATTSVTVVAVNDAPVLTGLQGDTVTQRAGGPTVLLDLGADALAADPDTSTNGVAGGTLTVTITGGGVAGEDLLSIVAGNGVTLSGSDILVDGSIHASFTGGTGGGPLVIVLNGDMTETLLARLLHQVGYTNTNGTDPSLGQRTITWTLNDGDGTANGGSDTGTATSYVNVDDGNNAPIIANLDNDNVSFFEGGSAVRIDLSQNALITDVDSPDFSGGTLTVAVTSGNADEYLSFITGGRITVSAVTVFVDGFSVAEFSGGAGTPLVFSLYEGATPERLSVLLQNLTYDNGNLDNPGPSLREISLTLVDGDGTANGGTDTVTVHTTVNIVGVNDAPTITGMTNDVATFLEGGSEVYLDVGQDAALADVDNASFDGGSLHVEFPGGGGATEFLSFTVGGRISIFGNDVVVDGQPIGTFSGGNEGAALHFNFTALATPANVQVLLQHITYYNTGANPGPATRTVQFTLIDGDGTANGGQDTLTFSTTVTILAVNDAPSGTDATLTVLEDGVHIFAASDFGLTDPDDSPSNALLAVKITTLPATGSLFLLGVGEVSANQFVSAADIAAGNLRYFPPANGNGANLASFTFQVQDDGGTANGGVDLDPTPNTITFNVTPVNDPAEITGPTSGNVTEAGGTNNTRGGVQVATGDLNSTDVDNSADAWQADARTTTYGSFSVDASGHWTYTLDNNNPAVQALRAGEPMTDSFVVYTEDNTAQTVIINITGANDAPANVVPGPITGDEDRPVNLNGVSIGDIDGLPGDTYTVTLSVAHGTLNIRTDVAGGITGANIIGGGNGTNGLTITGTLAQINATLGTANALTYLGDPNYNGTDSLRVATWEGVPADAASFTASGPITTGSTPVHLITADVNGDGLLDLVYTVGGTTSQAAYRLGNGNGTFGTETTLSGGNNVTSVAVGDVDGDGRADIVVANYAGAVGGAGSAGVYYGAVGGGFGTLQSIGSISQAYDVTIADMNGDGRADIIVDRRDTGQSFVILQTTTPRSFSAPVAYSNTPSNYTKSIVTGDFNNDGIADLVATNPGSSATGNPPGSITIRFGTGNGTLGTLFNVANSASTNIRYWEAAAADVNNDGNLDLVVTSLVDFLGFTVFMGDGTGSFANGVQYSTGANTTSIQLRDLNGDGILDAVFTTQGNPGATGWRLGNGNGTFQAAVTVPGGFNPESVAVGDFDGDGDMDIASVAQSDNTLRIFTNNSTNLGDTDTVAITLNPVNDAPSGTDATRTILEDGSYTFTAADFGYSDAVEGNAFLEVIITTLPANGTLTLNGGTVSAGQHIAVGSIPQLVFTPAANANGAGYGNFTFQVRDNGGTANSGTDTDQSANLFTLNVTAVNDAPVISGIGPSPTYTEDGPHAPIFGASTTVLDPELSAAGNYAGATLTVQRAGGANADDSYDFVGGNIFYVGASSNGAITSTLGGAHSVATGSRNGGTFTITFNANATQADVNAVLQQLAYQNINVNPAGPVTLNFTFSDGNAGAQGSGGAGLATGSVTMNIANVNDAPMLDPSRNVALAAVNEDTGAPAGAVGTLVSSLVDLASVPGGLDNVVEVDSGALLGIAITGIAAGGTLYYSLDGGANWTILASASDASALLLAADASTRIYYRPGADFNGTIANAITFRAWDRTAGTNGGTADTSVNGGMTAFSVNTDTASLTVNAVNDAPVNSVPATQSINEDNALTFTLANGNLITVSDVDANGADVTVTLTVLHGTLVVGGNAGLTSLTGDGTGTVQIVGSVAEVNNALNGLVYTPTANYHGPDTLQIVTSDNGNSGTGGILTDTDSVAITVNPVNDAPAGTDKTVTINEDTSYAFSATDFGFTDPVDNHGFQSVVITTLPANGTLTLNGNPVLAGAEIAVANIPNLVFTPAPNANGSGYGNFTFQVRDNGGTANGGVDLDPSANTFTLNVSAVNDAPTVTIAAMPVAWNQTALNSGILVNISSFVSGENFTLGASTVLSSATIFLTESIPSIEGTLEGFSGSLSFAIYQDNGSGLPGTLILSGVDLSPVLIDTGVNSAQGDIFRAEIDLGPVTLAAGNYWIAFHEGPWQSASDNSFVYMIASSNDMSGIGRVFTTNETNPDGTYALSPTSTAFSLAGPAVATEQVASSLKGLISVADVDAGAADLTVTLSVDYGILTVTAGGSGATVTGSGTSTVTITGTLAEIAALLATDITSVVSFTANTDNPPAAATLTVTANDGGATGADPGLSGGPADEQGSAQFVIPILAVNDAPQGTDHIVNGSEDDPYPFTAADFGYSDPAEGHAFAGVVISALPVQGTLTNNGVPVSVGDFITIADINAGLFRFTPDADEFGTNYASFTFQVRDNGPSGGVNVNTDQSPNVMTINIAPDNLPPVVDLNGAGAGINNIVTYIEDGAPVSIGLNLVVSDPDEGLGDRMESATITLTDRVAGDSLTYPALPPGFTAVTTSSATTYTIQIFGTGTTAQYQSILSGITYSTTNQDPTVGGTDTSRTITVTVNDGMADSAVATTTVNITAIDDLPVAYADAFTINENGTISGGNLFANNGSGADSDPDGPALSISAVNGSGGNVGSQITLASGALLTVNANGTFSYNPNGAFLSTPTAGSGASNTPGHDSFTYTLADGNTATVSITLTGLDSHDTLLGTSGADILMGGNGNDTYYVENNNDQVIEAAGQGNDRVITSVSYLLATGTSVETLEAVAGTVALALIGNEIGNNLIGNAGNNILNGQGGADVMTGGLGNDTYYVDTASDSVVELAGEGFDSLFTSISYALLAGSEVDWLSTISNSATTAINLVGNAFTQYLIGNNGVNILTGGGGADLMVGYAGNDTYIVTDAGAVAQETLGGGFDSVYTNVSYVLAVGSEVEWLSTLSDAGTSAINLTGNAFNNYLIGNAGANILDGGGGADTMIGYGGNDIYFVDNAGDVVSESAGNGFDSVYASVSYALAAGQEVEWLSTTNMNATDALNFTGNELANYLVGNAGANILDGKGGSDTLIGNAGADTFVFTTALGAGNVDFILGFEHGVDKIALDDAIFTAIGGPGALNANAFVVGSTAADASDRIIYNSLTGQLFYDADGTGAGVAVQFATLSPGLTLTASDFTVM